MPYIACFHITTEPVEGLHARVMVQTVFARVIDGKELGIHGGWANHEREVPPVQREEKNILDAIARAIAQGEGSKTN